MAVAEAEEGGGAGVTAVETVGTGMSPTTTGAARSPASPIAVIRVVAGGGHKGASGSRLWGGGMCGGRDGVRGEGREEKGDC